MLGRVRVSGSCGPRAPATEALALSLTSPTLSLPRSLRLSSQHITIQGPLCAPRMPTMPSEHTLPPTHDQAQSDLPQSQIKYCSCLANNDSPSPPFLLQPAQDPTTDNAIATLICAACGSCVLPSRIDPTVQQTRDGLFAEGERNLRRWAAALHGGGNEANNERLARPIHEHSHTPHQHTLDDEMDIETSSPIPPPTPLSSRPDATRPNSHLITTSSELSSRPVDCSPPSLSVDINRLTPAHSTHSYQIQASSPSSPFASSSRHRSRPVSPPDPLLDITRLRVRSRGHHCLYPGATFQGTQKSGRNSYDVNVTIVVRISTCSLANHVKIHS